MRLVLANLAGAFGKAMELKRKPVALLLLILVGGALLRVYALAAESFYFDEAYSVWAARHTVSWLLSLITQRIFPPLYYLLLHFWLVLGESEFAVRLLSVVLGLGSIVAIYTLAKQLFNARVGLLSACLLAISPLHLWFSQEARMYMLVLTLSLCSANFLLLVLREGRRWHWLAYVLTTALAMNAHYFALFLALFENAYVLYLLLRRRLQSGFWKHWVLSQLAIGLLSAVGLAGIFSEETDYWWGLLDTWQGAATWRDVVSVVLKFSLGPSVSGPLAYVVGLSLFGFCVVWALISLRPLPLSAAETEPAASLPHRTRAVSPLRSAFPDKNAGRLASAGRGERPERGWSTDVARDERRQAVRLAQDEAAASGLNEDGIPSERRRCDARTRTAEVWHRLSVVWDDGLVFTLLYLVVPIGAIFLISQFRSFWVLRYLFPFLPPYCVLTAQGIARMPGRALPTLVTIAILLASLWPISDIYRYQTKEDWRGAVQYIAAHEQPGDVLLMVDEDLWLPLEHYYHGSMTLLGVSRASTNRDFLAVRVGLAASTHKRIWLVLSHTDNLMLKDYLMTSGYTELVSERYFMSVEVDLFTVQSSPAAVGWSSGPAGGS